MSESENAQYKNPESFEELEEAVKNGKIIQFNLCGDWVNWDNPDFTSELSDYRIKL